MWESLWLSLSVVTQAPAVSLQAQTRLTRLTAHDTVNHTVLLHAPERIGQSQV